MMNCIQSIRSLNLSPEVTSYFMENYAEFERLKPYLFGQLPQVSLDTVPGIVSLFFDGELCGVSDPRIFEDTALKVVRVPTSKKTTTFEIQFDYQTVYFSVAGSLLINRIYVT